MIPLLERAHKRHDGFYRFPTYSGKTIGCRIRIIENRWNTVVIATDLSTSVYSSITLHTEDIATTICDTFEINKSTLLWIEHIPPRPDLDRLDDLYDLVHFEEQTGSFCRPYWTPLTPEEVDVLTGGLMATV